MKSKCGLMFFSMQIITDKKLKMKVLSNQFFQYKKSSKLT